jgi:ubiquinone biosynthesis protein Coq4
MKRTALTTRNWMATLALTTLIWAAPGQAQSPSTTPQNNGDDLVRWQLVNFNQFLDDHPEVSDQLRKNPSLVDDKQYVENHPALQQYLQQHPEIRADIQQNPNAVMYQEERYERTQDRDRNGITREEVVTMDRFLDQHPEVAEQLQKNPKLIDDQKWVANHPELQQFMAEHPKMRTEFDEHPYAFMHDEDRLNHQTNRPDITRGELVTMDQFLDKHPEISEQLQKNPKLIDDQKWVGNHPELQQFMKSHPEARQQFDEHPYAFMHDEDRLNHQTNRPDITRGELVTMDQFLDKHPEISEQLQKDPKLIDDQKWVGNHPELQQFMKSHPEVRQQFDEHPYAFMHDEDRLNQLKDHHNGDMDPSHLSSFHNFMQGHGAIAADISKNPTLATNDEYLQNHTELQAYLQANPEVKQQLNQNPQSFVKSAQETGTTTPGTAPKTTTATPKMPSSGPKQ